MALTLLGPIPGLLARALAVAVLACLLGLAGGRLAAYAIRDANLHWSWAGVALAAILLAFSRLGDLGPTLALAAVGACRRARREQREDLQAGGELRESALRRLTPVAAVRPLARALARSVSSSRTGAEADDGIGLGRDERGDEVLVPLGASTPAIHTLVLGATGSGKTVTLALLATGAIRRGMAAVVVDPKGDGALRRALADAAGETGRSFLEWTPAGPLHYNPYARGSETEIADRVLAGERYTEPHYLRQAQRYLGHAVRGLRAADKEISLKEIARCMEPERLEDLVRGLGQQEREGTQAYLDSLTTRQRADLSGVRDRISILCESDVGRWLDPPGAGGGRLELRDAMRGGAVVLFTLESDSRPLLAQMLGAAIVLDLQALVSSAQSRPLPAIVAIDEFSALAAAHVVGLFGRARSAGISLLLATQELADLRLSGRERMLDQVLGNLSLLIAHRQVLPASAELLAGLAGSEEVWRVSRHSDGRAIRTRAREPALQPDRLAGLQTGCAAVFEVGSGRGARITRVRAGAGT